MQEVVVYFVVALAIFFLIKKYVFPTKKDKNCNTDCGCH
ncbi:MAG: FeoB-associated Cys-rich membrane protein [Polaribacter sp.]|nr:FeoB-associated Cys-rich membrane protein [Polaribacter sp.]